MRILAVISHLTITFLLIFLFTLGLAQAKGKTDLKLAITLEPPALDPTINAASAIQKITYQNIFEGLTQINHLNQVVPSLAESWKIDKEGLIYTFRLRKNIYFHDRSRLTATIVKTSLEKVFDPNGRNPNKGKFSNVVEVSVVSRHVVRIKLRWPDDDLLYNLGLASAVIVHPKSIGGNKTNPIGTGPYRFSKWETGQYIELVTNGHYWGRLARIKLIKVVFAQTRAQVVSYLANGLLDGYSSMTEVGFLDALFAIRQDYILKIGNTSGEIIVAMNHSNTMLASLDVRKAISTAINKKEIADTANFMTGAEIGSHYSPTDFAYLDLTEAYPFSISNAQLLLRKSGVEIKPLRLLSPPPAYAQYISLHVQQMLAKIDIQVMIENVTWKEWLTRVYQKKDYDLTVIAHTESHDLDIYARHKYYFNYENSEFKLIMNALNRTVDAGKQEALLQQAQKMISDDAVNVFLFMLPKVGVWHEDLRGYWINEPIPAMIFSQMYWQEE